MRKEILMKAVYLEEGAVNKGDVSLEPITSLVIISETQVEKTWVFVYTVQKYCFL